MPVFATVNTSYLYFVRNCGFFINFRWLQVPFSFTFRFLNDSQRNDDRSWPRSYLLSVIRIRLFLTIIYTFPVSMHFDCSNCVTHRCISSIIMYRSPVCRARVELVPCVSFTGLDWSDLIITTQRTRLHVCKTLVYEIMTCCFSSPRACCIF